MLDPWNTLTVFFLREKKTKTQTRVTATFPAVWRLIEEKKKRRDGQQSRPRVRLKRELECVCAKREQDHIDTRM